MSEVFHLHVLWRSDPVRLQLLIRVPQWADLERSEAVRGHAAQLLLSGWLW